MTMIQLENLKKALDCFFELRAEISKTCGGLSFDGHSVVLRSALDCLFDEFLKDPGLDTWSRLHEFEARINDDGDREDLMVALLDAAFKYAKL